MAHGGPADLDHHVVVVGADNTTVRLVEELTRAGEQLVVVAPRTAPIDVTSEIQTLGGRVVVADHVREPELRRAGVDQAKAVVILGDDDVQALRVALVVEEVAPGLRMVIEMTNPQIANRSTELIGNCTLLSGADLAAPAFVTAALATNDTQTFEIAGRMVAVGPRDRIGGELTASAGSTAIGQLVCELAEAGTSRVLAWAPAGGDWTWGRGPHRVRPDDRIAVVATRSGLARLLRATKAGVVSPPATRSA